MIETVICPNCTETIELPEEVEIEDEVLCEECNTGYVITGTNPVQLAEISDEDEEEVDEDDEDDE